MNIHTEKGRANREAILGLVNAANDNIAQMEASNAPISTVTATFAAQREELIRVMTQIMGNREKAQQYIDKILQIPKSAGTTVTANTAPAMTALQALQDKLRAVNGVLTVTPGTGTYGQGQGVLARSAGGRVPGTPSNIDSVPAMLAPGEFVVRSSVASQWGSLLEGLNAGATPAEAIAGPAAVLAARRPAAAGSSGPTFVFNVSVSGVVGDHSEVIRQIGVGLKQGIDRGDLPRDLFAPAT